MRLWGIEKYYQQMLQESLDICLCESYLIVLKDDINHIGKINQHLNYQYQGLS